MVTDIMTKMKNVVEGDINCKVGECHFPLTGLELDNYVIVSSDELLQYEDYLSFRVRLSPSYLTSLR